MVVHGYDYKNKNFQLHSAIHSTRCFSIVLLFRSVALFVVFKFDSLLLILLVPSPEILELLFSQEISATDLAQRDGNCVGFDTILLEKKKNVPYNV